MANKTLHRGTWRLLDALNRLGKECSAPEPGDVVYEQDGAFGDYAPAPASAQPGAPKPAPRPGQREYRVITQRDEMFGGRFNPEQLELSLNQLAADGWRVVSIASADVSTFMGTFWSGRSARQELVVVLERVAGPDGWERGLTPRTN